MRHELAEKGRKQTEYCRVISLRRMYAKPLTKILWTKISKEYKSNQDVCANTESYLQVWLASYKNLNIRYFLIKSNNTS